MNISIHNIVSITNSKAFELDTGTWIRNITVVYKDNEYSDDVRSIEMKIFSKDKDKLRVKSSGKSKLINHRK
jgi:hypothetical protein